jgi:hypothetical protein
MLKLRVKPKGARITISLPEELFNQELEVIISPVKQDKKQIEKLKEILENRPKNIFQAIDNPVAWQRSLREEWKR